MLEHGRVSARQLAILIFTIRLAPVVCTSPTLTATSACRDTWLVNLLGMVGGLILALIVLATMSRYPGRTVTDFSREVLGNFLGKGLVLFLAVFLLINAAVEVRLYSDLHGASLVETPPIVFVVIISLVSLIAVRSGLEVLARASEILLIPLILALGSLLLLALRQVEPTNLLPVAENGLGPLIGMALTPTSAYGSLLIWLVFSANLKEIAQVRRAFLMGVIALGVVGSIIYLITLGVLGGEEAPHFFGPTLMLSKIVSIRDIIQGLDLLMFIIWMVVMLAAVTLQAYAGLIAMGEVFGIRDQRRLVGATILLVAVISRFLYADTIELRLFWDPYLWGSLGTLISFMIPGSLLIGARFHKASDGGRQSP